MVSGVRAMARFPFSLSLSLFLSPATPRYLINNCIYSKAVTRYVVGICRRSLIISCCGRSPYTVGSQGGDGGVAGREESGGRRTCPLWRLHGVSSGGSARGDGIMGACGRTHKLADCQVRRREGEREIRPCLG